MKRQIIITITCCEVMNNNLIIVCNNARDLCFSTLFVVTCELFSNICWQRTRVISQQGTKICWLTYFRSDTCDLSSRHVLAGLGQGLAGVWSWGKPGKAVTSGTLSRKVLQRNCLELPVGHCQGRFSRNTVWSYHRTHLAREAFSLLCGLSEIQPLLKNNSWKEEKRNSWQERQHNMYLQLFIAIQTIIGSSKIGCLVRTPRQFMYRYTGRLNL